MFPCFGVSVFILRGPGCGPYRGEKCQSRLSLSQLKGCHPVRCVGLTVSKNRQSSWAKNLEALPNSGCNAGTYTNCTSSHEPGRREKGGTLIRLYANPEANGTRGMWEAEETGDVSTVRPRRRSNLRRIDTVKKASKYWS